MDFDPGRFLVLLSWFFAGLYLVQRYGNSKLVSPVTKYLSYLLLLTLGPLYFLLLLGIFVLQKSQDGKTTLWEATQIGLSAQSVGSFSLVGPDARTPVVLRDGSGRTLDEIYSRVGGDSAVLLLTAEIVGQAVRDLASDILINPTSASQSAVRFRIDGRLRSVYELTSDESKSVINSIKAISGMDIAERRRPQDGAFVASTPQGNISFRVATAGVLNGEKISIRVLDQSVANYSLRDIGLTKKNFDLLSNQIQSPSGMILVCGPTGSGKSTTLHSMLKQIDFDSRNVITIEDPIEYVLPQASQIEINTKAEITFAKALRSVLRQDPDVISIGEIRDAETAEIALQASQTGHLVFATIHASSNPTALLRLIDLGIRPFLIASALNIVVSQRLVRKLCKHCKTTAKLPPDQIRSLQKRNLDLSRIKSAQGCSRCKGTGYRGRTGVFDVMVLSGKISERLAAGKLNMQNFGKGADGKTQHLLYQNATRLVLAGLTTFEEAKRLSTRVDS